MDAPVAPDDLRSQRIANLGRLMRPHSIAFVGGAQVSGPIRACRAGGFSGRIMVVNPTRDRIEGIACVPDIAALPTAPDAAVIAVSPARTVDAVAALAARGTAGAVCLSAGFKELDTQGAALQDRLVEAAGPMAVLGPNCMGVLNLFDGAAAWGEENHMAAPAGPGCAIISQSGAFLIGISNVEQVFPLGYAVSIGNQAAIGAADCIEALLDDPRVRAIGLYIEGVEDGAALGRACWRAAAQGVPVVALKGGDTAAAAAVAQSHTAAMVVDRPLWDAFCDRYGVVEVSSLKALVETLKLLTLAGIPRGPRLTVVSFSGGLNGQAAARAPGLGLRLDPPRPDNASTLRALLPDTVPITNPMDLNIPFRSTTGISLADGDAVARAMTLLAQDVADQLVFFLDVPRRDDKRLDEVWLPGTFALADTARTLGIPTAIAGILPEGLEPALRQRYLDLGLAPLCGFAETMEALSVAARRSAVTAGRGAAPALAPPRPPVPVTALDEDAGKTLVARFGVAVPVRRVCTPSEAPAAATALGFPVALKLLDAQILHKAQVGGVRLNLGSETEVAEAVVQMSAELGRAGITACRLLVERMVARPRRELILGITRTPAMGLAMVLGDGGSGVEDKARISTLLLPLLPDARDRALAAHGLTDHAAAGAAVAAVAALADDLGDRLQGIELNPLILTEDGGAVAADAVVQLRDATGTTARRDTP